jgi:hypothetical protein
MCITMEIKVSRGLCFRANPAPQGIGLNELCTWIKGFLPEASFDPETLKPETARCLR